MSESNHGSDHNPYAPSSIEIKTRVSAIDPNLEGDMSYKTLRALTKTRPWVFFVSVVCLIMAALLLLSGAYLYFHYGILPQIAGSTEQLPVVMGVALAYAALAVVYLIPGVLLWKYGARIGDFVLMPNMQRLQNAMESQLTFWRALGQMIIVVIGLNVAILILILAVTFSAVSL
jgi:hypothetical protein